MAIVDTTSASNRETGSQRHVLVTGGAGFIGSHLVEDLIEAGDRVTVLDNLSTGSLKNLASVSAHPSFTFVKGDAVEPLAPQLDGTVPTHIIHLAAQVSVIASIADPKRDLDQNLASTLQIIAFGQAAGVQRIVFASSAAVYGDGPQPSEEGLVPLPASPYGIHKLASEHHLRCASLIAQVPTTSLRFFNVYGPRQVPKSSYAGVISIFLASALAGEPLKVFGEGVATRDFVYVNDLVRAIGLALTAGPGRGDVFNVGTGRSISVRELAETAVAVTRSASPIEARPARPGEALHSRADVTRIASVLGWRATTPLSDGLAATASWLASSV